MSLAGSGSMTPREIDQLFAMLREVRDDVRHIRDTSDARMTAAESRIDKSEANWDRAAGAAWLVARVGGIVTTLGVLAGGLWWVRA